jgi:hypothetical protein
MDKSSIAIVAAFSLTMLAAPVAGAQAPAPKAAPAPGQQNCSAQINPAEPKTQGRETQSQGGADLSDKLARSNGVICPPGAVDPEMTAPPPGGGRTPIIPPPGTPGGNPNVQPK